MDSMKGAARELDSAFDATMAAQRARLAVPLAVE
jgi:hypothetical protein